MTLLQPNDQFPALTVTTVAHGSLELPDWFGSHFGVVLFFRGAWCPYCNAQLRAFERAREKLSELEVDVVALSVDDKATTQALVAKHGLGFPVGYGADAHAIVEATGAFVNKDPLHLQSTGFILGPGGRVILSVYSSGAIGRLVPEDIVGMVRHIREHARSTS